MTDQSQQKRQYRKKRRAEQEAETRRRITESAVELHGTVGPSQTTISAVAEHAGVRRSTLYRHFPDESALFDACSAHWAAANPFPDITRWEGISDPEERLRSALAELYPFYRRTERMLSNLHRDEEHPDVERTFAAFRQYLAAATDILLAGRRVRGRRRELVRAGLGHAIAFTTWRSLAVEQGIDDGDAVELMVRAVAAATEHRPR